MGTTKRGKTRTKNSTNPNAKHTNNSRHKSNTPRPMGKILLDMELLLDEMFEHDVQWGDVLALVFSHMQIHNPGSQEKYLDNSSPIFYYGPKEK